MLTSPLYRSLTWDLPLSKLYTNALLSTLNARVGWDRLHGAQDSDNPLFGQSTPVCPPLLTMYQLTLN